jgi:hypothetical protein
VQNILNYYCSLSLGRTASCNKVNLNFDVMTSFLANIVFVLFSVIYLFELFPFSSSSMSQATENFLSKYEEKGDFNQYWYSSYTIKKMVDEVMYLNGRTAFLSTPSLYFSIPEDNRSLCYVFDVSTIVWYFIFRDFNCSTINVGKRIHALFSMILIIQRMYLNNFIIPWMWL